MKFRNIKLWVILFGAILVLGAILFQQSQTNRDQLENQAVKSMEITRKNVLNAYEAYHEEMESYLQRKYFASLPSGTAQHRVAAGLNELFGNNTPSIDSSIYIEKTKLGHFTPKVTWGLGSKINLLDLNHPLDWDPLILIPTDPKQNQSFFEEILKTKNLSEIKISPEEKQWLIHSRIQLDKLMKKDQTNRFFDAILLTDETGRVIYPDSLAWMNVLDFEKIKKKDTVSHARAGVRIANLEISNNAYKGFWTPLTIRGQNLHLLGISESGKFEKVGLRINFNLLSILIFGLIIIFFTIPIINVLNFEKGDVLTKSKVFGVSLSFIVLMIILGISASYFKNQEDLVSLEKSQFQSLLSRYKKTFTQYNQAVRIFEPSMNTLPINEFLEIKNGNIQTLWIPGKKLSFDQDPSFISISNREYVSHFNDNSSDSLFSKNYVGSHYSRGSGKLESVISNDVTKDQIHAITFTFKEEHDPISWKHNYLIIKEDGKVIHKSQKISTPLDNVKDALQPLKWVEIQSLMKQNSDHLENPTYWEIPLYLNGYEYTGILQLLDGSSFDQPLWFIYLINQNLDHYRSSLTSLESTAMIFIYLLILSLIALIVKITTPDTNLVLFKAYAYEWLFPSLEKLSRYILLNILLLTHLLIFIFCYYLLNLHMVGITFISGLFAVQSFICIYLLIGPHWDRPDLQKDYFFLSLMGAIWLALAGLILFFQGIWVVQFILLFILSFIFLYKHKPKFKLIENKILSRFQKANIIFVIFLALWSILMGFLPGYMIQSKTYVFEKFIWNEKASTIPIHHEIDWIIAYEKYRRNLLTKLSDPFDEKIRKFIAPDRDVIYAAMDKHVIEQATATESKFFAGVGDFPELPWRLMEKIGENWIFVIMIVIALGIVVYLIYDLVKKIFLTDFIFKKLQIFSPKTSFPLQNIFLCGLDAAQNHQWIKDFLQIDSLEDIHVENMFENQNPNLISESLKGKKALLIENIHFHSDCKIILTQLPDWIRIGQELKIPLILTSGKSWKELHRCITEQPLKIKFTEIFSPFFFEYVPLNYSLQNRSPKSIDEWNREVKYGRNPEIVREKIKKYFGHHPEPSEDEILLIQRFNKAFYANLWEELSFQEKKVCYNYSKEGFINYANQESFSELIQKGILHRHPHKDQLMLFNRTFRNFILTYVSDEEIAAFKDDEKANGNSKTIQAAAISFVFLSIALIGYFDKNFLNEAYTVLSAGIGLIGTLYTMVNKGISTFRFGKSNAGN